MRITSCYLFAFRTMTENSVVITLRCFIDVYILFCGLAKYRLNKMNFVPERGTMSVIEIT